MEATHGVVTRDSPMYIIPGPKVAGPASTIDVCRLSPGDLWIIMANAGMWETVSG